MPDARCTRGLVCKWKSECAHEHTGPAETLRPSLRNGFTAYLALTPENSGLCRLRRLTETGASARSGLGNLRKT